MPQERPGRRIPYEVPGYAPFNIPARDSADFARLLELAAMPENNRPETYDRIAYAAFQQEHGLPASPGIRARYYPLMRDRHLLTADDSPTQPEQPAPQEDPFAGLSQRERALAERIRAARASRPDTAQAMQPEEPGFFERARERLRQPGEGKVEGWIFDEAGQAFMRGKERIADALPAEEPPPPRPEGAAPWGPGTAGAFQHHLRREAPSPPIEDNLKQLAFDYRSRDPHTPDYARGDLARLQIGEQTRQRMGVPQRTPSERDEYLRSLTVDRWKQKWEADRARELEEPDQPTQEIPQNGVGRYHQWLREQGEERMKGVPWPMRDIEPGPETPEDTRRFGSDDPWFALTPAQRVRDALARQANVGMELGHNTMAGFERVLSMGAGATGMLPETQADLMHLADLHKQAAEEYAQPDQVTLRGITEGKYPGHTAGAIAEWVWTRGGQAVFSMAPMLATGFGARALGFGAKGVGATMFATSYVMNYEELYDGLVDAGVPEDEALKLAAVYTVPVAGLDMVGAQAVAGEALTREAQHALVRDLARSVAMSRTRYGGIQAARGMFSEGITEGGQDFIGGLSEIIHQRPSRAPTREDIKDLAWRIVESAAAGALGGATVGGAVGAATKPDQNRWERALFESRALGVHPDPARAAEGEFFERRRGYAQQQPDTQRDRWGTFPTINLQRRASDPAVQAARGANLVPAETDAPVEGPTEAFTGEDRRRSAEEVEQIFLDLAKNNAAAVLNDISFLNVAGGFQHGVPPEAVPALEARMKELETKAGDEKQGAKYRRGKLTESALSIEEQQEKDAISWMLSNVMPIARMRREGEIDETRVEDRVKIMQAREGRLAEDVEAAPTARTPVEAPGTPPARTETGIAPEARQGPIPATRAASAYVPPAPGAELRWDLIPQYVAETAEVKRRDDVFQFRTTGPRSRGKGIPDTRTVDGESVKVEWEPQAAARTAMWVWKDTEGELGEKGAIYVVDGHNRLDKAQREGIGQLGVFFLNDAGHNTAQEARVAAALINMQQEGAAASPELVFDATTVIRESGYTREEIDRVVGGAPAGLLNTAVAIASLPEGIYQNYRDQERRYFQHDEVYAALGSHGLSEEAVLAIWKGITEGKRPNKNGYLPAPGGKGGVAGVIKGMVDYVRGGMPPGTQTDQLGFAMGGETEVNDRMVRIGDVMRRFASLLNEHIGDIEQLAKRGARQQEKGLIGDIKVDVEEESVAAKQLRGKWDQVQRSEEVRQIISATAEAFKGVGSTKRAQIAREAWSEIEKILLASDTGIEGEGAVAVSDDVSARSVEEQAAEYNPEDGFQPAVTETADEIAPREGEGRVGYAPPPEDGAALSDEDFFDLYGPIRRGAKMVYGPFHVLYRHETGRWNIWDVRTGEIHPETFEKAPEGYKHVGAARQSAADLLAKEQRDRQVPAAAEPKAVTAGPVQTEPEVVVEEDEVPVVEPIPKAEQETVEEADFEFEEPEAPTTQIPVDTDPVLSGKWESEDAPGRAPATNEARTLVRQSIAQAYQAAGQAPESALLPFVNFQLLFRNIARLHYILQHPDKVSRQQASVLTRTKERTRTLLKSFFPAAADVIDAFWLAAADPAQTVELYRAAHIELAESMGLDPADIGAMVNRLAEQYGFDERGRTRGSTLPNVDALTTPQTARIKLGKNRRPLAAVLGDLDAQLVNENGKTKTGSQTAGTKFKIYLDFLQTLLDNMESWWDAGLAWTDVVALSRRINRTGFFSLEDGQKRSNPFHKRMYSTENAGKFGNASTKIATPDNQRHGFKWETPWRAKNMGGDVAPHPHWDLVQRIEYARGKYERLYTWFMHPDFGQEQSRVTSRAEKDAWERARRKEERARSTAQRPVDDNPYRGGRRLKTQGEMFGEQSEQDRTLQEDFEAEARRQGVEVSQPGALVAQEQERARSELQQYVENMYDEWWDATQAGEDPLTLEQKQRLWQGMRLQAIETDEASFRNPNDIQILQSQIVNDITARNVQREQRRPTPERALSIDELLSTVEDLSPEDMELLNDLWGEGAQEAVEEAVRPVDISRRILLDVGIYDEDPSQAVTADKLGDTSWRSRRVKTIRDAFDMIEEAMKVTIRAKKFRFGPGTLGVFKVKSRSIRLKWKQDEEAAMHELGHALQYLLFNEHAYTPSGNLSNVILNKWAHELLPLAAGISSQDNVEGMAEFVRRYFNNPKAAERAAPDFHAFFEMQLQKNHPEIFEALTEVRGVLRMYRNAGPHGRFLANMHYPGRYNPLLPMRERLYRKLVDGMFPTAKISRILQGAPEYKAKAIRRKGRDPFVPVWEDVELLGRTLNGVNALAEHWVRRGQLAMVPAIDPATGLQRVGPNGEGLWDHAVVGPSLEAILSGVHEDMQEFELFATAKRVIERNLAPLLKAAKLAQELNMKAGSNRYSAQAVPGDPGRVGVWDSQSRRFVRKLDRLVLAFSYDDAKKIVKEVEDDPDKSYRYKKAFGQIQQYRDNQLRYLVVNGVITKQQYDRIVAGSSSYVPLRPVPPEKGEPTGVIGVLRARRGVERPHISAYRIGYVGEGVYHQKGDSGPIMPPLEAIYRDTYELMAIAHRARMARALHRAVEETPGAGWLLERVATPVQMTPLPLEAALAEIEKLVPEDTYDQLIADIDDATLANHMLWAFRAGDYHGQRGMVSFVDPSGKRHWYEVKDNDLYESLMAIESPSNEFMRLFFPAAPARWLRLGSTITPSFSLARNMPRDIIMGNIQSRHGLWSFGPLPGPAHLKALRHLWRGETGKPDEWYDRFIRGMGSFGALVDFDRNSIQREIDKATSNLGLKGIRFKNRPFTIGGKEFKVPLGFVVRDAGDAARLLSAMMENMTRMAEFMAAFEHYEQQYGTAEAELLAGYDARDVTTDFRRHGAATYAVRQGAAFWNANIQGWDKTIRTFKEDPRGAILRSLLHVTLPTIVLWAINHDDDDYRELPQWLRDYFWLIPLPFGVEALPEWLRDDYDPNMFVEAGSPAIGRGRKAWIKIPKPFGVGTAFGTLFERALDMMYEEDGPGAGAAFRDLVYREVGGFLPLPTFWAPLIENSKHLNWSFFFGRPIVPRELEGVAGQYHQQPGSTHLGRAVSQVTARVPHPFGVLDSPLKIDNLIYGYTGTLGRDALKVTEAALGAVGALDVQTAGSIRMSRIPFLRDVLQTNTQWTGTSASRVYELYEKAKTRTATANYLEKLATGGKEKNVEQYVSYITNEVAPNMGRDVTLGMAVGFFRLTDDAKHRIQNTDALTDMEKNRYIFTLADARAEVARRALAAYKDMQ